MHDECRGEIRRGGKKWIRHNVRKRSKWGAQGKPLVDRVKNLRPGARGEGGRRSFGKKLEGGANGAFTGDGLGRGLFRNPGTKGFSFGGGGLPLVIPEALGDRGKPPEKKGRFSKLRPAGASRPQKKGEAAPPAEKRTPQIKVFWGSKPRERPPSRYKKIPLIPSEKGQPKGGKKKVSLETQKKVL